MQTTSLVKFALVFSIMILVACVPKVSSPTAVSATSVQSVQPLREPRHEWITRWLNQEVCTPPCWEEIVPGETLLKDAIVLVEGIPDAKITGEWEQVFEWEMAGSDFGKAFTNLELRIAGNDSITWIGISINKNQSVVIEEVVDVYGSPSYIQVVDCNDVGSCDTNLIYSSIGMALHLYLELNPEGNVEIKGDSTIFQLLFFVPGIENYMAVSPYRFGSLKHWEGYGYYSQ
ncbi:MAG: hypothetical protein HFACDABA_02466 [Anaerolineales bacterium]|nr:hypothetical protein [Anaerolineales bacterium]